MTDEANVFHKLHSVFKNSYLACFAYISEFLLCKERQKALLKAQGRKNLVYCEEK